MHPPEMDPAVAEIEARLQEARFTESDAEIFLSKRAQRRLKSTKASDISYAWKQGYQFGVRESRFNGIAVFVGAAIGSLGFCVWAVMILAG